MKSAITVSDKTKWVFGLMGSSCLLLIIPVKALRWSEPIATSMIVGIAPSILGPAGLLFLLLSSSSPRLAHLTLPQASMLVGVIALGLEFIQLIPRHGILANIHYTFDWLDVAATLFSIAVGTTVARLLIDSKK